tara:strand:- start:172 stop:3114 length:2943 start_codon:yes stop_codon:yes gene_type:complete
MLEKELEEIVLKEKDIIPFLKKLSPKDKRDLVPFLKKFKEKIFEQNTVKKKSKYGMSYTSQYNYSEKQRELVQKAGYVCFNKTDIKKGFFNVSSLSVSDDYLENIIPWYTPKWFGDLINENMPWNLTYSKAISLYKDGLLEPSHELILNKLPSAIIEYKWDDKKRLSIYKPDVLLEYKETLDEHIWFLFEEESSINNYYNYLHLENYSKGNDIWIDTIVDLTNENKINRGKVLTATIFTSTKGFNKTLSGWFFDLLLKLNPTQDEILALQNEFFAALNSPYSKVINTVLKYFKTVADHKKFKSEIFTENATILLNSETKSVVNSTLMILEKIIKTQKSSRVNGCLKVAEALLNVDEKIQLRAAKIIEKYGDPKNQELVDEINLYSNTLFHSPNEILKEYLISSQDHDIEDPVYEVVEPKVISEENKIESYETFDDLIFFVSQAIDNNEVYHIDLLLSYLPKLSVLLNKTNVAKLEPIFIRCFDLSMSFDWNSQIGNLEVEAAYYINDFAKILLKKYPSELENYKKYKTVKINKLKEFRDFNSQLKEIESQSIPDFIYQIHHSIFIKSKSFIKYGLTLDLLSTPTHLPCWIDPQIFIERILAFQNISEEFNLYDFQIAIGRLQADILKTDTLKNINEIKDDEIISVLNYHFGLVAISSCSINRPEFWIQSVLSRNKEIEITYFQEQIGNSLVKEKGTYDWQCNSVEHFYKEYDYAQSKQVQKKMIRKELKFRNFNLQNNDPDSIISNLKNIFNFKKKSSKVSSIYNFMYFKKQRYYTTIRPNDDVKFLFLSPNNPSMFLSQVIHNNLKESTFSDESSKKNMINLLKGLYEIWHRSDYKESTYLFLASGILCSDKVARELSAEIWIKANFENKINNEHLGAIVGKLESGEYAPLKRFTDLLSTNLFNVSRAHNESLFVFLDHMIGSMNNTPIRGIKKLLEMFLELKQSFPQIEISEPTKVKLNLWKETKTLKSIIDKIEIHF